MIPHENSLFAMAAATLLTAERMIVTMSLRLCEERISRASPT